MDGWVDGGIEHKKKKKKKITFSDAGGEERRPLEGMRSVGPEQVPAGGGVLGGGGAELHPSIIFTSSSRCLHPVREERGALLEELLHLPVLLQDVGWGGGQEVT